MAGLAALMTRKKRDRRRELELRQHMQDTGSIAELTGKQAQEALQAKQAHETIKKMLIGKELLHQKSKQSFDALSQMSYNDNDDGSSKGGLGNAYSAIYIGLILMAIGAVITFVGLGEKGFKTLELKLIGPVLCLVGFTCITIKIIHCTFPQLFQIPAFIKKRKLGDASDKSNLMEKGTQNGHLTNGSTKNSPQFVSPRVTLQSSKKSSNNRPRSTIPNYIEDSSEDEDDFDPGRSRPHSNRYNSVEANNHSTHTSRPLQRQSSTFHSPDNDDANKMNKTNNVVVQSAAVQPMSSSSLSSDPQVGPKTAQTDKQQKGNNSEILLTPKALML